MAGGFRIGMPRGSDDEDFFLRGAFAGDGFSHVVMAEFNHDIGKFQGRGKIIALVHGGGDGHRRIVLRASNDHLPHATLCPIHQ